MFHSRAFCKVGKSLQFTESSPEISLVCGVPVSVTEKRKILTWLKIQPTHTHTCRPKSLCISSCKLHSDAMDGESRGGAMNERLCFSIISFQYVLYSPQC